MLRLAVATSAETYERMQTPLADRGIEAKVIETAERSIRVTGDDENGAGQFGDSFDVGFVFPPRLAEGGVADALLELVNVVNRHLDEHREYDYRGLRSAVETFEEFGGGVLGLQFGGAAGDGDISVAEELVDLLLEVREQERAAGNYERADQLRDDVERLGIEVQDTDEGYEYRFE